jgi:hypothetical protein
MRDDLSPIERGMIRAAEQDLGRPFTTDELRLLLPSPVTVTALRELVEALHDYARENPDEDP